MPANRSWKFETVEPWKVPKTAAPFTGFLVDDLWDDRTFKTLFQLHVADAKGRVHAVGSLKIGTFGMPERTRTSIPKRFNTLDDNYFSVGQDVEYYEKLRKAAGSRLSQLFRSLRDIAADAELFQRAAGEEVALTSLFRFISPVTVEGQFRRLARGEARTIQYNFSYNWQNLEADGSPLGLTFNVVPDASPPTNIHALIGSNGAGKTWILNQMSRAASIAPLHRVDFGSLTLADGSTDFAGQVSVSFSAFDELRTLDHESIRSLSGIPLTAVGLKTSAPGSEGTTKSSSELSDEFAQSLARCVASKREERWLRAISILRTDPLLGALDLSRLFQSGDSSSSMNYARTAFHEMSSGHKVVLLTLTRLVEVLEERTLVFLDEPETHLHPPLLSAFIHALSSLLAETNGVAIAATHSPVVLQEIPRSCVWVIDRGVGRTKARRPRIETFAENVSELTHEVFGLEVTESGYHSRVSEAALEYGIYGSVVASFRGQLGTEGRSIARALTSIQE
ncbi:AAA family ATPase [Cellulomonas sp. Leaf395]|uniref:AAA family ATPase n=1 Tax=Cellulomonas sp. Leaf395 TaxID=1736362 RepID=UPI00138ECF97|nr:AAA family ATPase [Cellulomonas sp. Leaf395]